MAKPRRIKRRSGAETKGGFSFEAFKHGLNEFNELRFVGSEDGRILAVERDGLLGRASGRRGEGENSGFARSNLFRFYKTKVVVLELARSAKELKL